jgi:hypothetical protein
MDFKQQVGETAGEVWHLLNQNGPQTLAQLKKKLNGGADLLNFAVGWLAREEKVDIVRESRTYRIHLRN